MRNSGGEGGDSVEEGVDERVPTGDAYVFSIEWDIPGNHQLDIRPADGIDDVAVHRLTPDVDHHAIVRTRWQ